MLEGSVEAIGRNANSAAFEGAALKVMAGILNLPPQFINHFVTQQKELTSELPIFNDIMRRFEVVEASHGAPFSPGSAAGISLGSQGVSLA